MSQWPSWRYGPKGASKICNSHEDVPPGWSDSPATAPLEDYVPPPPPPPPPEPEPEPVVEAAPEPKHKKKGKHAHVEPEAAPVEAEPEAEEPAAE
jgi:hypothetical protein